MAALRSVGDVDIGERSAANLGKERHPTVETAANLLATMILLCGLLSVQSSA